MKLQQVNAALYLARIQATSHQKAAKDQRLSFERAALWYLNQAQDELVNALREHHGLRGQADETQTLKELAARNLPSAAGDQILAWPYWGGLPEGGGAHFTGHRGRNDKRRGRGSGVDQTSHADGLSRLDRLVIGTLSVATKCLR